MENDLDGRIDVFEDPGSRQRLHQEVPEVVEAPTEVDNLLVDHLFRLDLVRRDEPTEDSGSPARARAMRLREVDQFAVLSQEAAFVNEPASVWVGRWHLGPGNEERVFDDRNLRRTGANPDLSQRLLDGHHQIVKPV